MNGMGISAKDLCDQKTDAYSCTISWSDQTTDNCLEGFPGNATCCRASFEATYRGPECPAVDLCRISGS